MQEKRKTTFGHMVGIESPKLKSVIGTWKAVNLWSTFHMIIFYDIHNPPCCQKSLWKNSGSGPPPINLSFMMYRKQGKENRKKSEIFKFSFCAFRLSIKTNFVVLRSILVMLGDHFDWIIQFSDDLELFFTPMTNF